MTTRRSLGVLLVGLLAALSPDVARAWDPSTTHQGLLESAVTRSAIHLRWMDTSAMERGLFTSLRVDPNRLSESQLRALQLAIRDSHADLGARPMGGPGACPSAGAPVDTQLFCVDRDLWEQSAIGWIRLGMLAEVTPSARLLRHFVDREDPGAASWSDDDLPAWVLRRRQAATNGEPRAGVVTRTNFAGESGSAVAWLDDPDDPLAPIQTFAHLELASRAASQADREHHLALALIGVGALLHLAQDLSVPAHARGDATAFFAPLSPAAGDRGLPLQEFVRLEYGRRELPGVSSSLPTQPPSGTPLTQTFLGHLLGDQDYDGLATLAGRHFLSESSVPPPRYLEDTLGASEAATALLGSDHGLAEVEVDGAVLSPWPAQRGYILSPTGRALAAFDTDSEGRIRPYLDEACYREQAAQLLPAAADVTRSLLDLIWPAWPTMQRSGDALHLTLDDSTWTSAELGVLVEDADGHRRAIAQHHLVVEGDNLIDIGMKLAAGERVVLILEAERIEGPPIILEHIIGTPAPQPAPPPDPIVPVPWD